MVRENRIKTYKFQGTDLNASAASVLSAFTDHPLNGLLQSIQVESNNFAAAGSLYLSISGTGEIMWTLASGTLTGMTSQSGNYLVRGAPREEDNTVWDLGAGIGVPVEYPINGNLRIHGGVGVSKSGLGISINYI